MNPPSLNNLAILANPLGLNRFRSLAKVRWLEYLARQAETAISAGHAFLQITGDSAVFSPYHQRARRLSEILLWASIAKRYRLEPSNL